ncbi:hypothetical protein J27TS8_27880 [Robertmurraya siralis]|uniref:Uncharacterized protein n=1 Tax=Robertmurraya siralis TaxID=77777 RepID=A0A920BU28_9BACI|nr:hypothetical protein [Robertmurraya sp. DFI.2.37]MDF1511422.1 hypothetical protein [Robertmurraya sp. DFI.2.37]GIN62795.1 hypothetical protein J27TS8_27880 [Robertmurraya siralis]
MLGKDVLYNEERYTIIFNYHNGMIEIRNSNLTYDVQLVNIKDVKIIDSSY